MDEGSQYSVGDLPELRSRCSARWRFVLPARMDKPSKRHCGAPTQTKKTFSYDCQCEVPTTAESPSTKINLQT